MWLQAFYDICNIDSLLWTDKNTAVSLKASLVLKNGNMEIVSKYFALYIFFLFLLPIFDWAEVWKLHFNYTTFSAVKFVAMVTHSNWRMQLICLILYWRRKEILGPKINKIKVKDRVSLRRLLPNERKIRWRAKSEQLWIVGCDVSTQYFNSDLLFLLFFKWQLKLEVVLHLFLL